MRKLMLFVATSLDGYIAGSSGGIDWMFTDHDYGYPEFFAGIDTVLMGRRTYELALSFGAYPYEGTEGFVFSRDEQPADGNVAFVAADPAGFVAGLKHRDGRDIWLVGGSEIIALCLAHDLVDELIISVHPLILGQGIPLFAPGLPEREVVLTRTESFASGLVQLSYRRPR
jgi:dihydrofolate reductase